jgi:hypothetical protein
MQIGTGVVTHGSDLAAALSGGFELSDGGRAQFCTIYRLNVFYLGKRRSDPPC